MRINPDETVAYGAAVWTAILSGDTSERTQDLLWLDVAPPSVSRPPVVTTALVERNAAVPTKKSKTFSTYADNRPGLVLLLLSVVFLRSRSPDIDVNGILNVPDANKTTKRPSPALFTNGKCHPPGRRLSV